jgi:hypothetical protein
MERTAVVLSTERRGVFFGYINAEVADRVRAGEQIATMTVYDARMVVYWSAATKGYTGLCGNGPAEGSRVAPPVPEMVLYSVMSVAFPPATAIKRFEAGPWSE